MRNSARVILQPTLFLFLGLVFLVSGAQAAGVNITFGGTVTGTGSGTSFPPGVAVGQSISGAFTFNFPATGSNGTYDFKATGQTELFSIPINNGTSTFGGQNQNTAPNNVYTIKITDTGAQGATFDIFTDLIDAAGKTGVTCDILFTSTTYTGLALPSSSGAFTSAFGNLKGKFTWDPPGAQSSGDSLGITADITTINNQAVPEPSGLVLAVIGLATCTAGSLIVARRRKAGNYLDSDQTGELSCS
jgi:hypothetical protein